MAENKTFDEKEYITKMYESALESQKQGLTQDHDRNQAALDEQQKKPQQKTDANLTRTYVEAAKDKQNYNEVQNAYGLSSGAMGQARLSQDHQLPADLTALRKAQLGAEAGIEQERTALAREYEAAIRKAQAESDLAKVQALYEQAQKEDDRLLAQQEAAAKLMAGQGDYSRLDALYGQTAEELAALNGESGYEHENDGPDDTKTEQEDGLPGKKDDNNSNEITGNNQESYYQEIARAVLDSRYGMPHVYASLVKDVVDFRNNGASGREILSYLQQAVREGMITQEQAGKIYNANLTQPTVRGS